VPKTPRLIHFGVISGVYAAGKLKEQVRSLDALVRIG
jgi:hypothetical protein